MPVLFEGDSNMIVFPMTYSVNAIARRFETLNEIDLAGIKADLLWDADSLVACVVGHDVDGDDRRQVLASIELERTDWYGEEALAVERYWEQDPTQVRGVIVLDNLRDFGLATFMYEALVLTKGLIIVSDNEQYAGGKALWKHIAKYSKKLDVFIFDSETKLFYPYDGSTKLNYDGNGNIADTEIWSLDPDHAKHPIVLVAEPNLEVISDS